MCFQLMEEQDVARYTSRLLIKIKAYSGCAVEKRAMHMVATVVPAQRAEGSNAATGKIKGTNFANANANADAKAAEVQRLENGKNTSYGKTIA